MAGNESSPTSKRPARTAFYASLRLASVSHPGFVLNPDSQTYPTDELARDMGHSSYRALIVASRLYDDEDFGFETQRVFLLMSSYRLSATLPRIEAEDYSPLSPSRDISWDDL